jgi:hypothetical protein
VAAPIIAPLRTRVHQALRLPVPSQAPPLCCFDKFTEMHTRKQARRRAAGAEVAEFGGCEARTGRKLVQEDGTDRLTEVEANY